MNMTKHAARKALWSLKHQIMQMEGALARARIDYNRIQNQLAPISLLPDEILSAVFEAGCVRPISGRPVCPPFEILVSQVSQHWRNVASGTPSLWTNVVLKAHAFHSFEMADVYLHRSKASALHLSIYIDKEYNTLEDITSLCRLIVPHVTRWCRVYIGCNWRLGFEHFLDRLPPFAPILQQLVFDCSSHDIDYGDNDESDVPRRILINGAPNLTSVSLRGITLKNSLPPLTAATHLWLDDLIPYSSTSSVRFTLTGLFALTHLVFGTDLSIRWENIGSIELPLLRRLHIIPSEDCGLISGLLATIAAPLLQHLLLENIVWDDISSLALEMDFDSAFKFPSLRSLTILIFINAYDFTPSKWRSFIATFPTVTHVTLSYSRMNTFFTSLDEQSNPMDTLESPLWPMLDTLALLDEPRKFNVALIRAAVSARISLGHPIRRLQVSKAIMRMLKEEMQWLRARVEVEECAIYPSMMQTSIANWPEYEVVSNGWEMAPEETYKLSCIDGQTG